MFKHVRDQDKNKSKILRKWKKIETLSLIVSSEFQKVQLQSHSWFATAVDKIMNYGIYLFHSHDQYSAYLNYLF